MIERTPWAVMLGAARGLGVTPHQFWRLSLNEWRALTQPLLSAGAMPRDAFEGLARRFPDQPK